VDEGIENKITNSASDNNFKWHGTSFKIIIYDMFWLVPYVKPTS